MIQDLKVHLHQVRTGITTINKATFTSCKNDKIHLGLFKLIRLHMMKIKWILYDNL